jgi:hypothetical protein
MRQARLAGVAMAGEIIYSVFVSSTYEDLRGERAAVQKALLQLHCMPIGMELFGSADEETWEFIKRQIDDCDYYVVIVADKYGSTAHDGVSYTEKEYDYAREIKKPVLAFVHGNRGAIPRDNTEADREKRSKLEAFIENVRRSPVSFFTSPDELAKEVAVSFVKQRERVPAVGFIRANQSVNHKHAEILEENVALKKRLSELSVPRPDTGYVPWPSGSATADSRDVPHPWVLLGLDVHMGAVSVRDTAKDADTVSVYGEGLPVFQTKSACEAAMRHAIQKYSGKSHAEVNLPPAIDRSLTAGSP